MSAIDVFLKKDDRGARRPTLLTWVLVCVVVFASYFMSQNTTIAVKPHKTAIMNEHQEAEAANNYSGSGSKVTDDLSGSPFPGTKRTAHRSEGIRRPATLGGGSKMIVFDNTKDYQSDEMVPLGSMVKCLLIHNIVTNNFNAPVIAQVWEDFYFDGKLLIPFGARIYGTAFAGRQRDRVMVQFHSIVFQDGKTIKINGIGLSQDGSGGLTGTVIDERNKKMFIEMAMNFLTGLAAGLQKTATNAVTGMTEVESTSRNAILTGVANTFQKEAQRIQRESEEAKGYAIVLAGSELTVYLEKEADVHPF